MNLKGVSGEQNGVYYGHALYDLAAERMIPFSEIGTGATGLQGPKGDQGVRGSPWRSRSSRT